ncbi:MAG: cobalamin-dependent protein [Deltaproteobacteria bacterium]|nr:cobalamin-dependent protein [Deltaproteobacteria bacterium]MBW2135594.1 cobalamin-dependent protein [Deltaproteobacteria bacterium]
MNQPPTILLINPWIYDFAAYDFFARPLGLLYLAGRLLAQGYAVRLIDCLEPAPDRITSVTGRYLKEPLPPPAPLVGIPRRYGRYGISETDFKVKLSITHRPATVLVTSLMTYWYPGVQAVIRLVRDQFPGVAIVLGGIYATLCPEHARQHSGADLVRTGPGEPEILNLLAELTGWDRPLPPVLDDLDALPYPALHLLPERRLIPVLTSRGCPMDCAYCAAKLLQPRFRQRRPTAVVEELSYWQARLGVKEVAFYDDALLVEAETHLLPILEGVLSRGLNIRFHTPNGLHLKLINPRVAKWLKKANFATLRLGLETTALGQERLDSKVQEGDLEQALAALREAGFTRAQIGVYLLIGLPQQEDSQIAASIRQVRALGATPVLAQYSPIPYTALWPEAVRVSRYDLAAEPLYHNNSIFPCWPEFSWPRCSRLKRLATGGEE